MISHRIQRWPELLASFIEERRHAPFVWGRNDCCLFAADWVAFALGRKPEPAMELAGSYEGATGALRAAKVRGISREGDPFGVLSWPVLAGLRPVPPVYAGRGDIVAVRVDKLLALGICMGLHHAAPGPDGLIFLPRVAAEAAWKV